MKPGWQAIGRRLARRCRGIIAKATNLPIADPPVDIDTIAARDGAGNIFHDVGVIPARPDVKSDARRG